MDIKLYCVVSNEAIAASNGNRGKMMAQGGHAWIGAMLNSMGHFAKDAQAYFDSQVVAKICLRADEAQLFQMAELYKNKCGIYLVKDAGLTVFPTPMITALGIGPICVDEREEILSNLKPWI